MMAERAVLNRRTVSDWLYPERMHPFATEVLHPWRAEPCPRFQGPLLRIWDGSSGSQPDNNSGRMMSRNPEMRLDIDEIRKSSLAKHLDHGEWIPSPYISFTSSPTAIELLALKRAGRSRKGEQMLTVIDPNKRLKSGLPILDVRVEMSYYDILDPYRRSNEYYENHFVCLWEVTPAEVVGHWKWNELSDNNDWFQTIILPAYRQSTKDDSMIVNPNTISAGNAAVDPANDIDVLESAFSNLNGGSGSDISDGEPDYYLERDWGSDDEVEERNRQDDIIKIIEGDW
ncbi:hypothetical protein SCUP515_12993 [Seiridium cupressi]